MSTKKNSDVLPQCLGILWLLNASDFWLVDTLGWVSDWSEQFVHQTWNKNIVVYYGSWKPNMEQTMCDWFVVRSGACFGRRWKPVCDTAPLFGLDWYPASVAATEIFSTLIRLFTPNSVAAAFQLEPIAEKLVFSICICRNQNSNQLSWPIN